MNNWISVKERLPENFGSVLIYFKKGGRVIGHYDQTFKQWKNADNKWCDYDINCPVTHWQPLPAPPVDER